MNSAHLEAKSNSVMSLPVFPVEIFRLIVEGLCEPQRSTLHALTLTNKHLNNEATHSLYASMTERDGTRQYKFLLRIRNSPHLAKLVQVYSFPFTQNTQRGSLSQLIGRCVPLMVNLKELIIPNATDLSHPDPPSATIGRCSFRLRRLTWVTSRSVFKDSRHLLSTQPELVHLYYGINFLPNIRHNAFPEIRSLGAFPRVANAILQEQPINTFHFLIYQETQYDHQNKERVYRGELGEVSKLLQREILSLHYLSFDCNPTCLLKHFREEEIRFFWPVRVLYVQEAPDEKVLDMAPYLPKFPSLEGLVVTTRKPITGERRGVIRSGVSQFFRDNPNLKWVDISWESPRLYQRWIEGVPRPLLIELSEDWIINRQPSTPLLDY